MPKQFFFRGITWNDLIFGAVNIIINAMILVDNSPNRNHNDGDATTMRIRQFLMFGIVIIFFKLLYFLSLFASVAPLISMIKEIVYDIRWFSVICAIFIYAFSISFYIIG